MIDYSLQTLPKMEVLPSMLFEDSAESLSSTLQVRKSFEKIIFNNNIASYIVFQNTWLINVNVLDAIGLLGII